MELQPDLFGEPPRDPAQSQFFTPIWIAQRLASWIPRGARILEPCCGTGNLIEGLLRAGHRATAITGIERDPRMAEFARERFGRRVAILNFDFFDVEVPPNAFDVVVANFPFEDNQHLRFTVQALKSVQVVVGVFPCTFEFTQERDRSLWAHRGQVTRRALFPERVPYEGPGGSFESVALRITRREHSRRHDEERHVVEETWLPDVQPFAGMEQVP